MHPKLVAIAGPLQGETFVLSDQEVTIGRAPKNWLSVHSMRLSRQHCSLRLEGGQLRVQDLDSTNGTFVNDVPVIERYLDHGDQLRLADCLFVFLTAESESAAAPNEMPLSETVLLSETEANGGVVVARRIDDRAYERPESVLNTLLQVSSSIGGARGVEELQNKLLDLTLDAIPAERAVILLFAEASEEIRSQYRRHRSAAIATAPVSRTILRRVMREQIALLYDDRLDFSPDARESLGAARISAVLAAPLVAFQKVLGVVYLDTTEPRARFEEHHLQLLSTVGAIAAATMETARRIEHLTHENERLSVEMRLQHNMIGEGPRMRGIYELIEKVAPSGSTVLICGESGTGKELAARAIHTGSARAAGPFVAINCAALSESLIESELFGHEKGSFTGAIAQKKGKVELAAGGTLFLDEIGELALGQQAKLLRVLQEREFERVGGTRPIRADIRLIAATNRDLPEQIRKGAFRQDLYYRLNVVSFVMPPLRERMEDMPLLASYFATKYARQCNRSVTGVSRHARELLSRYDWPGNVRELGNAIERAVVLGTTEEILADDLPDSIAEAGGESMGGAAGNKFHETIRDLKRQLVLKAMDQANQNYTEAARLLGLHPNNLHRLMKNLNLKGG